MSYKVTNLTDKTLYAGEHVFIPHDVNQVSSLNPEILNFVDQGLFRIGSWEVDSVVSKEDLAQKLDFKKGAALAQFPSFDVGTIIKSKSNPGPGWLECDGAPYNRADYPELAALRPHGAFVAEISTITPQLNNIYWAGGTTFIGFDSTVSGNVSRSIWRSTDNGVTWILAVDAFPENVYVWSKISRHPVSGKLLLAAQDTNTSFISTDSGLTWTKVGNIGVYTQYGISTGGDSVNATWWYAARNNQNKYYRSLDDCVTWTEYVLPVAGYWTYIHGSGYSNDAFITQADKPSAIDVWSSGSNYGYSASPVVMYTEDPVAKKHYLIDGVTSDVCTFDTPSYTYIKLTNLSDVGTFNNTIAATGSKVVALSRSILNPNITDSASVYSYDGITFEYGKNVFANLKSANITAYLSMSATNSNVMLVSSPLTHTLIKILQDPTKFNNFGIPDEHGIKSYVFSGKTN